MKLCNIILLLVTAVSCSRWADAQVANGQIYNGAPDMRIGNTAARGWAVNDIETAIEMPKRSYSLGEPIEARLVIFNPGKNPVTVVDSGAQETYAVALFDSNGFAAQRSIRALRAANYTGPFSEFYNRIERLYPGTEVREHRFDLRGWFDISIPGTYRLVVARPAGVGWVQGIAISNEVEFTVVPAAPVVPQPLAVGGLQGGKSLTDDDAISLDKVARAGRWGFTAHGLALSVQATAGKVRLGGKCSIQTSVKNFGTRPVIITEPDPISTLQLGLYDMDGNAVPKASKTNLPTGRLNSAGSTNFAVKIAPTGRIDSLPTDLNDWFIISKPGEYRLLAISRVLFPSGADQTLISNELTITVAPKH